MRRWRTGRKSEGRRRASLERDLASLRPEPSRDLVRSITGEIQPRSTRRRIVPRVALAGAFTAILTAAVASVGGFGLAANRVSEWGLAVSHVAVAHPIQTARVVAARSTISSNVASPSTPATAANTQYQPQPTPFPTERAGYCEAGGDLWPTTTADHTAGTPIPPGTFLNLYIGQPLVDSTYAHAVTASLYVQGIGITCAAPPGYVLSPLGPVNWAGLAGLPDSIYPYYVKSSS